MEKTVAVIDLKSFYASAECAVRHLDPFKTPLACVDPNRGPNTVVMSVTPYLKEVYGLSNVCRKKDLPKIKGLIYAVPRMEMYLRLSAKVVSIFLDYVAEEDLHVYSVDESFLDLTPYGWLYDEGPIRLVKEIQSKIYEKTGLIATAGLAPNPFLAKVALDVEGKKKAPYIAKWTYDDVKTKLWRIEPIEKIWGISHGIKSHLSRIGIKSLYELAQADDGLLAKEFGIIGEQLKRLANGLDDSKISEKYVPENPSFNYGQTLYRPYSKKEGELVLREIVDELGYRLRRNAKECKKIALFVLFAGGGAYQKQRALPFKTSDVDLLYEHALDLYRQAEDSDIIGLSVSLGNLSEYCPFAQFSFLSDAEKYQKDERLSYAMDAVNETFGKSTLLRATSLLPHSMIKERHEQIGGHRR